MPLSATKNGPFGVIATPQGLIKFGSTCGAGRKPSETRLCTAKRVPAPAGSAKVGAKFDFTATSLEIAPMDRATSKVAQAPKRVVVPTRYIDAFGRLFIPRQR